MKTGRIYASCILLAVAACLLSGCAALEIKRDFSKIFSPYLSNVDDNPVIIIPGITGSRLVDRESGKMLWGAVR